jgi:hypothetical protein
VLSGDHGWFVVSAQPHWAEANLTYSDDPVFWSHADGNDVVESIGAME